MLLLTLCVLLVVAIVTGLAVSLLHYGGHPLECACGRLADPANPCGMCDHCTSRAAIASGACRLCAERLAAADGLCGSCAVVFEGQQRW